MKPYNKQITSNVLITIILFSFILAGCAGQTVKKAEMTPEQQFEINMKRLIEDVDALNTNTPMELAPVAVMSGSIKKGQPSIVLKNTQWFNFSSGCENSTTFMR